MDLKFEHEVLLSLLDDIQDIFRLNNIPYFLIGGSAIGAVRDGKIIPWDDDIDIGIPRKMYDEATRILENNGLFKLYKPSVDKEYILTFMKVVKKVNGENLIDSETGIEGAYIDIFPLDHTSDNFLIRKLHYIQYRIGHKLIVAKTQPSMIKKYGILNKMIVNFVKNISIKKIFKMRDSYIRSGKNLFKNSHILYNFGSPYKFDKEIYFVNEINGKLDFDFSGRIVPIAKGYDSILSRTYGDYMTPPQKEKQIQKHLSNN